MDIWSNSFIEKIKLFFHSWTKTKRESTNSICNNDNDNGNNNNINSNNGNKGNIGNNIKGNNNDCNNIYKFKTKTVQASKK
jgi:hypothetical protein